MKATRTTYLIKVSEKYLQAMKDRIAFNGYDPLGMDAYLKASRHHNKMKANSITIKLTGE